MKLAIVSMAVGDFYNKVAELTFPTLRKYAERIGADFIELQPNDVYKKFPHYLKYELGTVLDNYDRICYIDADIVVSPIAPNIFEKVPEDKMGLFEEGKYENRLAALQNYFTEKGLNAVATQYFNTGVIVASKEHKRVFEAPEVSEVSLFEQTYLNYRILMLDNYINKEQILKDMITILVNMLWTLYYVVLMN
jgi:lipopolysaccharide biosynthesis glycosyltransferase